MRDTFYFIKIKADGEMNEQVTEVLWSEHAMGVEEIIDDVNKFFIAYYSDKAELNNIKNALMKLSRVEIINEGEIKEQDWAKDWMREMKPLRIGKDIIIKFGVLKRKYKSKYVITIIPALAFGTGFHESTVLCLKALHALDLKNKIVLDIGCGTGILSIFAVMKGARKVVALDTDHDSIQESLRNGGLNRCLDRIELVQGTVESVKDAHFDVVVSNLYKGVILEEMKTIIECLAKDGIWIFSGIAQNDKIEILEQARTFSMNIHWKKLNEWLCGALTMGSD